MLFDTVLIESIPAPTMFVIRNHGLGSVTISLIGDNALCACTSKHRRCDTTKAKLVRSTPDTFKDLRYPLYI